MLVHTRRPAGAPARVVVLGANGFLGRALLQVVSEASVPTLAVSRAMVDLSDVDAAPRLAKMLLPSDTVVVLAAITPDRARDDAAFVANIRMGWSILTALEQVGVEHVVYLSSDAVYPFSDAPTTEATAPRPADLYGLMHLTREAMFRVVGRAPLAILRCTMVYGAEDTHDAYGPNRFRRQARREGRIVMFGQGEETRDHLVVADAARLVWEVVRHRSRGLLNLATGQSISYAELAKRVAACFQSPVDIASAKRQIPVAHRRFDVTALLRAFPAFRFTSLDDGLREAHRCMLADGSW